jgi:hypothetical protein
VVTGDLCTRTANESQLFPDELARLQSALEAWTSTLPPFGDREFDPEDEETLRELGYVG